MSTRLVLLGLALAEAYSPGSASLRGARLLRARRAVTVTNDLSILGAEDAESACVLLPHTPFDGEAPSLVFGEMNLQELEDDTDSITQLFLNADGTITHGVTEAPPPVAVCGLWQCGTKQFQMTLTRSFTNPGMTLPPGYDASWKLKDYTYSVTRIFLGNVNPNAFNPNEALGGVNVVEGRMELYDERVYSGGKAYTIPIGTIDNDERSPYSGEVLTSFQLDAPIGWFSLDKVAALEDGDGPGAGDDRFAAGTYGGGAGGAPTAHQIEVHTGAGKGFGGGEATRNPDATVIDPNDPKAKQGAIHKAESFSDYLARRGGAATSISAPAAAPPAASAPAAYEPPPAAPAYVPPPAPPAAPIAHQIEVHTGAGKGFGGGEATRNPDATVIDPNDPKAKQGAIHKAESFAEYLARRPA